MRMRTSIQSTRGNIITEDPYTLPGNSSHVRMTQTKVKELVYKHRSPWESQNKVNSQRENL